MICHNRSKARHTRLPPPPSCLPSFCSTWRSCSMHILLPLVHHLNAILHGFFPRHVAWSLSLSLFQEKIYKKGLTISSSVLILASVSSCCRSILLLFSLCTWSIFLNQMYLPDKIFLILNSEQNTNLSSICSNWRHNKPWRILQLSCSIWASTSRFVTIPASWV